MRAQGCGAQAACSWITACCLWPPSMAGPECCRMHPLVSSPCFSCCVLRFLAELLVLLCAVRPGLMHGAALPGLPCSRWEMGNRAWTSCQKFLHRSQPAAWIQWSSVCCQSKGLLQIHSVLEKQLCSFTVLPTNRARGFAQHCCTKWVSLRWGHVVVGAAGVGVCVGALSLSVGTALGARRAAPGHPHVHLPRQQRSHFSHQQEL